MNAILSDFLWWLLASPIMFIAWVMRMVRCVQFWKIAYTAEIPCPNCGASISLVGFWKCSCHFTYRGHLLRECPICGSVPRMVRCFNCGVTERLPELCD